MSSPRFQTLQADLTNLTQEWSNNRETGRVLIRPTDAQKDAATAAAEEFPADRLAVDLAVLLATRYAETLEQQGVRPADFWNMTDLPEKVSARVAAFLRTPSNEFSASFRAALKGRG